MSNSLTKDQVLDLQAFVDGQLTPDRQSAVARLLATDPQAALVVREIKNVRAAIRTGEPRLPVPATREFYWSQIQRRIAAETPKPSRTTTTEPIPSSWLSWLRWLVPALGITAVAAFLLAPRSGKIDSYGSSIAALSEDETAQSRTSSLVYRSDADGVTIHWIH